MNLTLIFILCASLKFIECGTGPGFIYGQIKSKHFCLLDDDKNCRDINRLVIDDEITITGDTEIDEKYKNENIEGIKIDGFDGKIDALPVKLAEIFPNLIFYKIKHADVVRIEKKYFENLKMLKSLIFFTSIEQIDEDSFDDLTELEVFELKGTNLRIFDPNIVKSMKKLQKLVLSFNKFTTMPENAFANLPELKKVDMGSNKLTTLPENIFQNNPKLEQISLSNNDITILSPKVFENLENLKSLYTIGNPCTNKYYGAFLDSSEEVVIDRPYHIDFNILSKDLMANCTGM